MAFDGKHTDPIATNREVIALCATLREEGRAATPQEQVLLARYTGWGALGRVFDEARTDLEPQREALLAAVGEAGFAEMRASILTSYFTPPTVAGALWSGLVRMGFQGGRIVDPAAGSGALIAEAPPEIANRLQWLAIERCPVTCGVLRSRFPAARVVEMPFEGVPVQYGSCDAMVVNPPFDDGMVADEFDKHLTASAHNFFLMKGLRTLRVGGLAAVVVSRYFMDGVDSSVRENISKTARLVAAFRLPAGAFLSTGTEVVTDVLFFQRTAHDTERNPTAWVESVEWQSGLRISKWVLDHPEWMLGEAQVRPDAYGKDAFHLAGRGGDWPNMLMRLVGALPVGIYRDAMTAGNSDAAEPDIEVNDGDRTPVFGLALDSQGCPVRRLQNRLDAKAWQREPMPDAKVRSVAVLVIHFGTSKSPK